MLARFVSSEQPAIPALLMIGCWGNAINDTQRRHRRIARGGLGHLARSRRAVGGAAIRTALPCRHYFNGAHAHQGLGGRRAWLITIYGSPLLEGVA